MAKELKKLTQVQREVLEFLRDGAMITIDRNNMPWLGDRMLQPVTRYFLTDNRLITRLDKSRPVDAKGNGFVISEKGLSMLEQQRSPRKIKSLSNIKVDDEKNKSNRPTERQLAFANDLGIDVPSDATSEEVSDLISFQLEKDKPANERHRSIARLYGVKFTKFTGKRQLFEHIFNAVGRPTHEKELAAWFTYRVYRHLVQGADNVPIDGPDHPTIKQIAVQLVADEAILSSIQRYDAQDLLSFGQWIAPDGTLYTGGSKRTAAYEKTVALLKERLDVREGQGVTS